MENENKVEIEVVEKKKINKKIIISLFLIVLLFFLSPFLFPQTIIKIVGLIYKLYLTNKENFGDHGNAIYAAGFQIYTIFLTISSIGVPNAISKLVSAKLAIGDDSV